MAIEGKVDELYLLPPLFFRLRLLRLELACRVEISVEPPWWRGFNV